MLADKGNGSNCIRGLIEDQDCRPNIPPRRHRCHCITCSKTRYKQLDLIERCFNKLKQIRQIALRSNRNALN
jgi:transposase